MVDLLLFNKSSPHLNGDFSTIMRCQVMDRSYRYGVVLSNGGQDESYDEQQSLLLTNMPDLQISPRTSPQTTSRVIRYPGSLPACWAIWSKLRLRSRPIVSTLLRRFAGSGRYFPFPVPESRPIQPVGRSARNLAMMGQGCKT